MTEAQSRTASHLRIPLEEYDARIATFIPRYATMLDQVATAVASLGIDAPVLLDLGVGTGALSARCLAACGGGSVIGIDTDPGMLELARARLEGTRAPRDEGGASDAGAADAADGPGGAGSTAPASLQLLEGSYLDVELPTCDAAIASFSLHHVRDAAEKQRLYRRLRRAVRPGGGLVVADCYLPESSVLIEAGMDAWAAHLERSYPPDEARGYLDAWAEEDTYVPLRLELEWLAAAGFRPDLLWRRDLFAVLFCV